MAPLNFILGCLFDETDTLEHVGDVVDAALRHTQHLDGLVQIEGKQRLRCLYDLDEASGQLAEGVVAASPSTACLCLLALLVVQLVALEFADRNFLPLTWHQTLLLLTVRLSVKLVEVIIAGHGPLLRLPLDWLT